MKKILFILLTFILCSKSFANIKTKEDYKKVGKQINKTVNEIEGFIEEHKKLEQEIEKKIVSSDQYYKKYKTILYNNKNIDVIKKVLERYKKVKSGNKEKIQITEINENEQEETTLLNKESGILFLQSILFLNKDNWTVWLNNKQITNLDEGNNEFKIININKNSVKILWQISSTKWKYLASNSISPPTDYKVNEKNQIELIRTLYPNQSFILFIDKIIEGKFEESKHIPKKEEDRVDINTQEDLNLEELLGI